MWLCRVRRNGMKQIWLWATFMSILSILSGKWDWPESRVRAIWILLLPEIAGDWWAKYCQPSQGPSCPYTPFTGGAHSEAVFVIPNSSLSAFAGSDPSCAISVLQSTLCGTQLLNSYTLCSFPSSFGRAPIRWRWSLPMQSGSISENKQNFKVVVPHPVPSGLSWRHSFYSSKWVTKMTSLEKSAFSVVMNSSSESSF